MLYCWMCWHALIKVVILAVFVMFCWCSQFLHPGFDREWYTEALLQNGMFLRFVEIMRKHLKWHIGHLVYHAKMLYSWQDYGKGLTKMWLIVLRRIVTSAKNKGYIPCCSVICWGGNIGLVVKTVRVIGWKGVWIMKWRL